MAQGTPGLPAATGGAPTAANISQLGSMVGADPATLQAVTQGLSAIQQLQSIQSISGITNLMNSSLVKNALSGLNLGQMGQALDGILQGALDPSKIQSMIQAGAVQAITSAIGQQFPQVAQALQAVQGGLQQAVTTALTQIGTQIAGEVGGAIGAAIGAALGGAVGGGGGGTSGPGGNPGSCTFQCSPYCQKCKTDIPNHHGDIRSNITSEFERHRSWIVNTFWLEHVLPALQLMAEQLSVAGIQQVNMFGMLLDAKHQLETQRLFQQMTAEAHKDYQPSEGMCTFGTTVRSLAGSERRSNLTQTAFAARMNQRQLMSGDVTSLEANDSDIRSRLAKFTTTYCDKADNANGLEKLCPSSTSAPERKNIDVDYTRNIESRLTLETDFTKTGTDVTPDEEDIFALSANLYAHNIPPRIEPDLLATQDGRIRQNAAELLMDQRAIFAKRSVAQNSFAAITAQRAAGAPESAPYTKAIIKELGVSDPTEIEKLLGKNPSYFAQMEILTKKIYQNPLFYTELYDKPANIDRKGAAMQAIGLMQDRDLYNSLLRSEAVLSVLLETMLQKEQEKITNAIPGMTPVGGPR